MRRILIGATLLMLGGCGFANWLEGGKTNVTPPAPLVKFKPSITVRRLWSTKTGAGAGSKYLTLRPALHGDTLFVSDHVGDVSAYSAASGKQLWRTRLKAPLTGATSYGVGMVVVGTRNGQVIAIDAATGARMWTAQVSSEVLSPPAVVLGMVVVQTIDSKLTALSAKDGSVLWTQDHEQPSLMLYASSTPVIDHGMVISGFANGRVYATNLLSGVSLWESQVGHPHGSDEIERLIDVDAQPIVSQGAVYAAAYQGNAVALSVDSGRVLWSTPASTYRNIALGTERLYLSDSSDNVVALDRNSGAPVWKQAALSGRRISGPALIGQEAVVGDYAGYLHWMSRATGAFVARDRIGKSAIRTQPIAAVQGGTQVLFVLNQKGRLSALVPSS